MADLPGPSAEEAALATADLLAAVDEGSLNAGVARDLEGRGADLRQGLDYAISLGRTVAVLILADECAVRLSDTEDLAATKEVLRLAAERDWPMVAYHLAVAADADVEAFQDSLLAAVDQRARAELRRAAGEARVQLPRDLRLAFARTGKLPPVLLVEQPRWLLPRPRKDQCFITASGTKLEEGWYCVIQYPLGDDLKEALLRRKYWGHEDRDRAIAIVRGVGETLFCKAVKDEQWELVEWAAAKADAARLAEQAQAEYTHLWDRPDRIAYLQSHQELGQLCACLDHGGILSRPWRHGPLTIPAGAAVVWPTMEALREALALDNLSLHALHMIGGARVTFRLRPDPEVRSAWVSDLLALGGESFLAFPLLHRAVDAGRLELTRRLLQAMVDAEATDWRGYTALAVAAGSRQWEAIDVLLREGCRADGTSGALAIAATQRATRSGSYEEADRAAQLLERLQDRQQRAPCVDLAEYFRRQARGEVVHGIEPRRYDLQDRALRLRAGELRVAARAMVLDGDAPDHEVCFLVMDLEGYSRAADARVMDLAGRPLLREPQLVRAGAQFALPVAVPAGRLEPDGQGALRLRPLGRGLLPLPQLARAPPAGGLSVEAVTSCCRESVGRVGILVDGVRVGETLDPAPGATTSDEVKLLVPAREMEVVAELCGRRLVGERIVGGPDASLCVEVDISVFVYVTLVDADEGIEFIFVCGHRRDVPEDAQPFIGKVVWDGGSQQLASFQPAVLGASDCLARLSSMQLEPDLRPGRVFEAVTWEDTSTEEQRACQFQRCLVNPVRVGKIFNG